jgi:hypothetical protein
MLHEAMTMDLKDFGAYCVVMDLVYHYGGAVRDDANLIVRYMRGCNARGWIKIRSRLLEGGHIYEESGTLRCTRADAELTTAAMLREANAMGGHISQAVQRKARRLHHGPDRRKIDGSYGLSSAYDPANLKTEAAKNNGLAEVHSSYTHTQSQTHKERREEENGSAASSAALESVVGAEAFPLTPSDNPTSEQAASSARGSGEEGRLSSSELKPIVIGDYLARQIRGRR